jgi:hypothetical protein
VTPWIQIQIVRSPADNDGSFGAKQQECRMISRRWQISTPLVPIQGWNDGINTVFLVVHIQTSNRILQVFHGGFSDKRVLDLQPRSREFAIWQVQQTGQRVRFA